ncbi:MAG: efflux transporter outer membrane subunit [Nitrospirota bacterium]|nr:efflux transporter outer membrane subunit [Nitrospirota bacterium]MDH5699686.1 efflux transporter outer membrane subunit [Nitrospirota bacterium]
MRSATGIVLLAMVSLSCAMGPDYTRPDIDSADRFRMSDTEGESIANLPWWELLHDEELQRLIERALVENKNLQQAAASVEEFQARLYTARTDFIPQADMTVNAPVVGRLNGFNAPGFATPFSYYGQGNLNWELDIWGRIRRSTEAARADLMAREENRRAVVLQLVSGVAQSYFDLLQFDMQLGIAKRTLLSWEESVTIARARLRQGVSSKLDADQFEAERANAAARVAELERQMVQTENELSVLLGNNPMAVSRGRSLTEQVLPPEVPAGLPSELLERRPDILQAEQALAAATARIGATKAARFPRLSITGLLGVASPQLSNLLNGGNEFGQAGLGLAGPILNAETLGFEQQAVEAQAKQVLAQYEQTILVAFQEVEDALVAVRTVGTQRKAQEDQVTALRSALHLANLRYKGGITSYIDVLIAKRSLFEAELALTDTHRLHLVSVVQLYKALGGGWSPDSPPFTSSPSLSRHLSQ